MVCCVQQRKGGGRREVEQAFKLCARFLIETLRVEPG